jgi:hypothetical protein
VNTTLAVIGFVFLGAAVIGGGLKAAGIEVPVINKSLQQMLLSIIGVLALVAAVAAPRLDAQASSPRSVASTFTSAPTFVSGSPAPSSGTPPSQSPSVQSGPSQSQQSAPLPSLPTHPTCFDSVFNSIPKQRVVVLQSTNGTWNQVGPVYRGGLGDVGGEYGLLLTDQGYQGAVRVNIDPANQTFIIEKAVHDNCNSMTMTANSTSQTTQSGPLGTLIYFYLDGSFEYINFRTETGGSQYLLEVHF